MSLPSSSNDTRNHKVKKKNKFSSIIRERLNTQLSHKHERIYYKVLIDDLKSHKHFYFLPLDSWTAIELMN